MHNSKIDSLRTIALKDQLYLAWIHIYINKAEIKNLFGYINVSSLKKFIQNLPSLKFLKFLKEEDLKHGILNDPDTKVIIFFFIFS